MAATSLAALATACVGTQTTEPTTPKDQQAKPDKPAEPVVEDITLEGFDEVTLTGMRFVPEGLTAPGMVRVVPKRKVPLKRQRRKVARAKSPAKKAVETKILVTMLWDESKKLARAPQPADGAKAPEKTAEDFKEEALNLLREAHTSLGEEFDDILLQMWFTAELQTGNEEGALQAGSELLERFGDTPSAKALAPWVAYLYLTRWKTDEAEKIVEGWNIDEMDPKKDYHRAYTLAWVAFRRGDYETARKAIVWSAKNWKSLSTRSAIERDFLLILARAGTPVDEAAAAIAELSGGKVDVQYVWLYRLYKGYELAGYELQAAAALDKALQVFGDKVPPKDRVVIRQSQSGNYLIAHAPAKMVDALVAAHKAVGPCGDKCPNMDQQIAERAKQLGQHFHTTYATTQDDAFFGPAKRLYEFYLSTNPPDAETIKNYLAQIEETKGRLEANQGTHDKTIMQWSTEVRKQAVQACYEQVLQSEPELTGSLKVSLEIDQTGKVAGVVTEPAAGQEGLAAVGTCLQERARAWKFPARTKKGKTTVIRTYRVEPKAEPSPSA